ncbi:serpin family protein [Ornithinimicrobium cavernae]|uniref:serpin family protein n=1 Tax=Ornithinimicrobium cavernae TaxID=2666047 RepID=UPI00192A1C35|nr:serpin family protein [Ornithinimicrobium cavernae]
MQRRTRSCLALFVTVPVVMTLTSCGPQARDVPPGDTATGTLPASQVVRAEVMLAEARAVADVVDAADVLGLDLINEGAGTTTVTSPASLQVALSMAAEGAEGQTLAELEAIIGAEGADRSEAINALTATLEEFDGDPALVQDDELPETPLVHRADRLVMDDSLDVRQDFVDALTVNYGATADVTDLAGPAGKKVLDEWVNEHTGGLVPESAIQPTDTLRLVLQDAIVLAARWEAPFAASLTTPQDFTLPGGETVTVDMMTTGRAREVYYAEVEGWQAVRLPYTGGRLHADIVLPPEGSAPTAMSPAVLGQIRAILDREERVAVILSMPVADTRSALDLKPYLTDHAPAALDGGFSGISDTSLTIEQAFQQGVLRIDEEGTVAAAVTEIGFGESGMAEPPLEFSVDRPYLVRIADGETGWPLFLAHITDPRSTD